METSLTSSDDWLMDDTVPYDTDLIKDIELSDEILYKLEAIFSEDES